MVLSCYQRESVARNKNTAEQLDGDTPPYGFTLNDKGRAVISTSLGSAIQ